jgi:hypothetical protein
VRAGPVPHSSRLTVAPTGAIGSCRRALQVEAETAEKSDMPPIIKRIRKPSDANSPDLATLLEPYGTSDDKDPDPDGAPGSEPSAQDDDA